MNWPVFFAVFGIASAAAVYVWLSMWLEEKFGEWVFLPMAALAAALLCGFFIPVSA